MHTRRCGCRLSDWPNRSSITFIDNRAHCMTEQPSPPPETESPTANTPPINDWQAALSELISSRIELIRLESSEATRIAAKKTTQAIIIAVCLATAWFALMVSITCLIHHFCKVDWWLITLILATLHFILAMVFFTQLKQSSAPIFPVTRTEFQKDRLWLQRIKTKQSNH